EHRAPGRRRHPRAHRHAGAPPRQDPGTRGTDRAPALRVPRRRRAGSRTARWVPGWAPWRLPSRVGLFQDAARVPPASAVARELVLDRLDGVLRLVLQVLDLLLRGAGGAFHLALASELVVVAEIADGLL